MGVSGIFSERAIVGCWISFACTFGVWILQVVSAVPCVELCAESCACQEIKGLLLHLSAFEGWNLSSLCHLPHIPSLLRAIKTGSKGHVELRHLEVIWNKWGPQIKTCPRSQGLIFWGPRQLHVPSGDAVPMSSLPGTSSSAKAEWSRSEGKWPDSLERC